MFFPPIAGYVLLLLVVLGLTLVQRRGGLGRNSAFGIRTKHTLASDAAWASAQMAARGYLVAMAAIAGGHAIALLSIQLGDLSESLGHVLAVSGFVMIVGMALFAWRAADLAALASTRSGV